MQATNEKGGEREPMEAVKWALDHNPCSVICVVASWLPDGYIESGIRQILRLAEEISVARVLILTAVGQGQSLEAPRKPYHRPANNVRWAAAPEELIRSKLFGGSAPLLPASVIAQGGSVRDVVSGLRPADVKTVETKARQTAKIPDSAGSLPGSVKGALADGTSAANATAAPLKIPDIAPCPQTVAELLEVAKGRALQIQQKLKQVTANGGSPVDPKMLEERESETAALLQSAQQLRFQGGEGDKSRARVLHERGQETNSNLSIAESLLAKSEGSAGQEALVRAIGAVLVRVDSAAPWLLETTSSLHNLQAGAGRGPSKRLSPLATSLANLSVHSHPSPHQPRHSSLPPAASPPAATRLFSNDSHASAASGYAAQPPSSHPTPASLPLSWSVVGSSPLSATLSSTSLRPEPSAEPEKRASLRGEREQRRALMQQVRQHITLH